MSWADIDFARNLLRVRDLKDADKVTIRDVPISARLRAELLMHQTAPDGTTHPPLAYAFGNEVGEPIGRISTAWETLVLKAHGQPVVRDAKSHGLTPASRDAYQRIDLVFHDLRHEGGSRLLELGWPIHQVSAMLGHKSIATTQIYLNVRAGDLSAQMAATDTARTASAGKSDTKVTQKPLGDPRPAVSLSLEKAGKSRVH